MIFIDYYIGRRNSLCGRRLGLGFLDGEELISIQSFILFNRTKQVDSNSKLMEIFPINRIKYCTS